MRDRSAVPAIRDPNSKISGRCVRNTGEIGSGVEQDYEQAAYWMRLAAEQGTVGAQHVLGELYRHGLGVEENHEQAVHWNRLAADQGEAAAQYSLASAYGRGEGVEQDDVQEMYWCRKAADQHYDRAQLEMGISYHAGRGVERNDEKAVHWYRLAADQGNMRARYRLGNSYHFGEGVEQDDEQAIHWWRLAAEQGGSNAQNNLGVVHLNGSGVEQDHEQAVHWFLLAADQGNAEAQTNLGNVYAGGLGVEPDREKAIHWYSLAAEQKHEDAKYQLTLLKNANYQTAEIIEFPKKEVQYQDILLRRFQSIDDSEYLYRRLDELKQAIIEIQEKIITKEELFVRLEQTYSVIESNYISIKKLLEIGECRTVEYKETFSYNTRNENSGDINIRHAVLRAAAAFLNTEGGVILIGVSDDKVVTGIEKDDFENTEKYIRLIISKLTEALGVLAASMIKLEIHEYEGKLICSIRCAKSPVPIFCEYKNFGQETFIRLENTSQKLMPKDWGIYCKDHFKDE